MLGDFGALIERDSQKHWARSEQELPYPKNVIRAAHEVALNDLSYKSILEQLFATVVLLEDYFTDDELTPYRSAIDAAAVQQATLTSPEYRALLASDPEAALRAMAALPADTYERLQPLQRLHRYRVDLRQRDLLKLFPHLWTEEDRARIFTNWMLRHAASVLEVADAVVGALGRLRTDERIAALHVRDHFAELRRLVDEADGWVVPPSEEKRRVWYFSVVFHTAEALRDISTALMDRQEQNPEDAWNRFHGMRKILDQLAQKGREVDEAVVRNVLEKRTQSAL